jgi:tetratricopeptide (TPR) repeat protein
MVRIFDPVVKEPHADLPKMLLFLPSSPRRGIESSRLAPGIEEDCMAVRSSRLWVRGVATSVAVGAALVAASPRTLGALRLDAPAITATTPDAALTLLHEGKAKPEQLDGLESVLKTASQSEPANANWKLGLALIDRARGKRVEARTALEPLVASDPSNAKVQMWYGLLCFETVQQAGTFEQASLASSGRAACEKAIELDSSLIAPHVALVQFFVQAPGLFGGSYKKATQHAQALIDMPEGKGELMGRFQMAFIYGHKEEWKAMEEQYDLAEKAAEKKPESERTDAMRSVLRSRGNAILNQKKDPKAALVVLDKYRAIAATDDATVWFYTGEAKKALKDRPGAIEAYAKAIEINPAAASSRFALATLLEEDKKFADAATHYEEFAKRFPSDSRAAKATASGKACRERAK